MDMFAPGVFRNLFQIRSCNKVSCLLLDLLGEVLIPLELPASMSRELPNNSLWNSLFQEDAWARVPEIMDAEILDSSRTASLPKLLPDIPTVRSFRIRKTRSRPRRKQVFVPLIARQTSQGVDCGLGQDEVFRLTVLRRWNVEKGNRSG
jgi:hypothetical protein